MIRTRHLVNCFCLVMTIHISINVFNAIIGLIEHNLRFELNFVAKSFLTFPPQPLCPSRITKLQHFRTVSDQIESSIHCHDLSFISPISLAFCFHFSSTTISISKRMSPSGKVKKFGIANYEANNLQWHLEAYSLNTIFMFVSALGGRKKFSS
jgi:hypothetical protein